MRYQHILMVLLIGVIAGCSPTTGEEIARIKLDRASTGGSPAIKELEIDLKAGEKIYLWNEMDLTYEGEVALLFQIQVINGTDTLGVMRFNPLDNDMIIGEVKNTVGGITNWEFSGYSKFWTIKKDGNYQLKAFLSTNGNETLQMRKADLVLRK